MRTDRATTTVLFSFNDLLLSLLACVLIFIMFVAPPKKPVTEDADTKPAGNVSVYVFWPDGLDTDIDLHLQGPDGEHVFFAHTSGKIWSLLRDDLGRQGDPGNHNFENGFARAVVPGEYVVNVAAYRGQTADYPVTVDVEVRIKADASKGTSFDTTIRRKIVLDHTGEEVTAARFQMDDDGHLIPTSINSIFTPLVGVL